MYKLNKNMQMLCRVSCRGRVLLKSFFVGVPPSGSGRKSTFQQSGETLDLQEKDGARRIKSETETGPEFESRLACERKRWRRNYSNVWAAPKK